MAAHQAPPSLGFSRQEHWSGLPFPFPMHESGKWNVCQLEEKRMGINKTTGKGTECYDPKQMLLFQAATEVKPQWEVFTIFSSSK